MVRIICFQLHVHPSILSRNIVNGLRDDDLESVYNSRASFASEYSTREPTEEGVKVYFKEHGRAVSKGSNSSFVPRKKSQAEKGRPETAVSA